MTWGRGVDLVCGIVGACLQKIACTAQKKPCLAVGQAFGWSVRAVLIRSRAHAKGVCVLTVTTAPPQPVPHPQPHPVPVSHRVASPHLQCRKMKRYRRHTLTNTTEKTRNVGIVDNFGKKIKKYFGAKKPTKQGVFVLLDRPPIR